MHETDYCVLHHEQKFNSHPTGVFTKPIIHIE